jgi:hypothetical protein
MAATSATPSTEAAASLSRQTLACGLLLGFMADRLWADYGPAPLTLLLLLSTFCGCALWLARSGGSRVLTAQVLWSTVAMMCIGMMLLRDTEILNLLMLLSLPTTIALFLLQRSGLGLLCF